MDADRLTKDQFIAANRLAAIDTSRLDVTDGGGHVVFDVTDRDGVISRQEFIRTIREHLLSNDPDAPGSLFFGRV
ncbi:hypothetical protein [Streptomyces sp. NPDC005435]|uniref:hypothetical protein n=1 Tax=Streptomyces sp. NPDC005435 TaxID=3154464 RepID=UPI003451F767